MPLCLRLSWCQLCTAYQVLALRAEGSARFMLRRFAARSASAVTRSTALASQGRRAKGLPSGELGVNVGSAVD